MRGNLLVNSKPTKKKPAPGIDTAATVILNDGSSISSVICQFEKENVWEVKDLKEGDNITIKGICTGYLMDVVMVRCVVGQ